MVRTQSQRGKPGETEYFKYFVIITCIILTLTIVTGYFFGYRVAFYAGDSMHPTYEAGCHFGIEQTIDNPNTIQEGDIVTYSGYQGTTTHRVKQIYSSFNNSNTNSYYINKSGYFIINSDNSRISHQYYSPKITSQTYTDAQQLTNKQVYVFKGDNNNAVDPFFATQDDLYTTPLYTIDIPNLFSTCTQ